MKRPLLALVITLEVAAHAPLSATQTAGEGSGMSYWGPIAPAHDSVLAAFVSRPTPAWESALLVPYHIIGFPLHLFSLGVGTTIELLDESRALATIGAMLGPRRGPLGIGISVQAGALTGFAAGVALEHSAFLRRPGSSLRGRVSISTRGDHRLSLATRFAEAAGGTIVLSSGYRQRSQALFFGIGPTATASGRSFFRQNLAWVGGAYHRDIGRHFAIAGETVFSTTGTLTPKPELELPITTVFASGLPPGYGEHTRGVSFRATLTHDDTRFTGRPTSGGVRRLRASYFHSTDGAPVSLVTYRAEAQQFTRLWHPHTVLALRGMISWIDNAGAGPIPFTRLLTNDDPDLLRGFNDMRWRDRGLLVLTAEYRWPLWVYERQEGTGLDLYLLTDVGQVFGEFNDITRENLTVSWGGGLRLLGSRGFGLRIEHARSDEGSVWRMRTDQVFQFARGSLFYGRDPIPAR
ncbi:MAG TPA: BamA/TamA family outer membrane protein [Gemmatimonadales bacterium]